MESDVLIKLVRSVDDVKHVLTNREIWETSGPDCPVEEFDFDQYLKMLTIGLYLDGEIAGLVIAHPFEDGGMIHPAVLPKHRKEHAHKFVGEALQYTGNPTYVYVRDDLRHQTKFYERLGFKQLSDNHEVMGKMYTLLARVH